MTYCCDFNQVQYYDYFDYIICNKPNKILIFITVENLISYVLIYLLVQCPPPINGTLQCPNEATGAYEDNCTFSCNPGYELQGSQNGICLANQTWNKGLPTCIPLNCPTVLNYGTVTIPSSCGLMYLSACNVSCPEGFTGDDVTYLCNVTSDPDMLEWVSMADADIMCERGLYVNF